MKHLLWVAGLAVLVGLALANSAEARKQRQWCWYGPSWGTSHAASDSVANRLNRAELSQIGVTGRDGPNQAAGNPQPLHR